MAFNNIRASDGRVLFLGVFLVLVFSGFFWAPTQLHRNILYIGGIISALLLYTPFVKNWFSDDGFSFQKLKQVIKKPLFIAAALFLAYSTLSVLWSDTDQSSRIVKFTKIFFILPLFLSVYIAAVNNTPKIYKSALLTFIGTALISSIFILVNHYVLQHSDGLRLEGFGRAENSVMLALFTAVACLLVTFPDKEIFHLFKKIWVRLALLAVLFPVLVLTMSRGPLLAFLISVVVICFFKKKYLPVLIAVGGVVTVGFIAFLLDVPIDKVIERGTSGRNHIWQQAITLIQEKVLFGHGVATKHLYDVPYKETVLQMPHAHSLYFSVLIQGGIINLGLLLATYWFAFKAALVDLIHEKRSSSFIFLSMGALVGLTDFGGFNTNLGGAWLVFWMPIGYLLAVNLRNRVSQSGKTAST